MPTETDGEYYERRARAELDLAAATSEPSIKAIHLDMAARYATLRELGAPRPASSADDD